MGNLIEYYGKTVELTDTDGEKWNGTVKTYTPVADSEDEVEEIGLLTQTKGLIGFYANEIKSIEEIK